MVRKRRLVAAFGSSPTQVLQLGPGPIRGVAQGGAVAEEARQDVEVASSISHHRRDVQLELTLVMPLSRSHRRVLDTRGAIIVTRERRRSRAAS